MLKVAAYLICSIMMIGCCNCKIKISPIKNIYSKDSDLKNKFDGIMIQRSCEYELYKVK